MTRSTINNLCLAMLLLVGVPLPSAAMAMRVAGDQAILTGRLVPTDTDAFAQLLQKNPTITTVVLWNSPGGSAAANKGLTDLIGDHKLKTAVAGFCVSACAMVFLAGIERQFSDGTPIDSTSLGFHGSYVDGVLAGEQRLTYLANLVETETAGKADPKLVDHWLHLPSEHTTVRFRYPGADGAPKTATVFDCKGPGPNHGDYGNCAPIDGPNAISMGIITSTTILHVNQ
jgi:hypothetical protein